MTGWRNKILFGRVWKALPWLVGKIKQLNQSKEGRASSIDIQEVPIFHCGIVPRGVATISPMKPALTTRYFTPQQTSVCHRNGHVVVIRKCQQSLSILYILHITEYRVQMCYLHRIALIQIYNYKKYSQKYSQQYFILLT